MPSPNRHRVVALHHLAPAPRADPARYPGERPAFDYLLAGDRILPIAPGSGGWRVTGSWLPDASDVVPLTGRLPVVAFGSNASPAQLVAKFGVTERIPVTRARLRGFSLGHSPHVSIPGYIPWVLVDDPGSVVDCAVLWLDDGQRARLDVTEPNYDLVRVDAVRYPLVVRAVDAVIGYAAYRGRWGALRWPGRDGPTAASTQAAVFHRLGELGWFRQLVGDAADRLESCQRRLAAEGQLRERVRSELLSRGMAMPDGWGG